MIGTNCAQVGKGMLTQRPRLKNQGSTLIENFCLFNRILLDFILFFPVTFPVNNLMGLPQLLYVDAYDSFTNNIVALLKTSLGANIHIVKIDDSRILDLKDEIKFAKFLHQFDAVVVGPGPGNPKNREDIGWITRIWKLPSEYIIPVFGICLGFQSFCHAFGASVCRFT
jgi:hypothetical protein